jgi:hypothetical protein
MKKILAVLCFLLVTPSLWADSYGGFGIGLTEACRTKYQPSFSGGDCISPNLDFRGLVGNQVSEYWSLEGSLDVALNPGTMLDFVIGSNDDESFFYDRGVSSNRWAIVTFGVHALGHLPLTDSLSLFAGPSLAGSIVNFDYDVTYFGNGDSDSHSATEFGINYGWAAGIDFFKSDQGFVRLQWQNWRSLDADVAYNGEFNSNSLTLNWITYF